MDSLFSFFSYSARRCEWNEIKENHFMYIVHCVVSDIFFYVRLKVDKLLFLHKKKVFFFFNSHDIDVCFFGKENILRNLAQFSETKKNIFR